MTKQSGPVRNEERERGAGNDDTHKKKTIIHFCYSFTIICSVHALMNWSACGIILRSQCFPNCPPQAMCQRDNDACNSNSVINPINNNKGKEKRLSIWCGNRRNINTINGWRTEESVFMFCVFVCSVFS